MKLLKSPAGRRLALVALLLPAAANPYSAKRPVPPQVLPAVAAVIPAAPAVALSEPDLAMRLADAAPAASREVLRLAARAMSCALRDPAFGVDPRRLGVIDYSRPSTEPRLWVFDLVARKLLFEEWVAHGRNSGGNLTTSFSNRDGSYILSISYKGSNRLPDIMRGSFAWGWDYTEFTLDEKGGHRRYVVGWQELRPLNRDGSLMRGVQDEPIALRKRPE